MIQRTASAHAAVPSINGLARFFNRPHHGLMVKYVDAGSLSQRAATPQCPVRSISGRSLFLFHLPWSRLRAREENL